MTLYAIPQPADPQSLLAAYGVRSGGIAIMAEKMELLYVHIHDLKTPAANILKQDALSIGAELAVPGGVVTCETDRVDCLLIGSRKHIRQLARKAATQAFGLRDVARALTRLLSPRSQYPIRIMGVVNANTDSFYAGSRFVAEAAVERMEAMMAEGAQIIDVGGVSSRPGSRPVSPAEELARVRPICDAVARKNLHEQALFSIDSDTPEVIAYALEHGFGLINDITGARNPAVIDLAVRHGAALCIMHMQGEPQTMQSDPRYTDVTAEVDAFFGERIAACTARGLPRDRIILDPGIGFGKTLAHNLALLRNLRQFSHHGAEILVGASRKSMIDAIVPAPVDARLPGTLALHLRALEHGATILRCHDVAEHAQAVAVWEALRS